MILIKITLYSYFKFLPKNKIFHLLYWTTLSSKIGIHAITLCQMTITLEFQLALIHIKKYRCWKTRFSVVQKVTKSFTVLLILGEHSWCKIAVSHSRSFESNMKKYK